ncbi:helix-turn-helix domain-containing protein [Microbacterium sp. ANT_H45B]|uniref:transcriptional regulator n=1 Tax=Microbacterium sp. ANT_H45B TaxID=2597346 RepID=UPI0011EFBFFD|nr:transcriptional regulator [Microbacterium sp. ANT_H45B]KAA0960695.1 helix-turn-helix domain-containing protein [Microbacterium sp. ANT_H45B]
MAEAKFDPLIHAPHRLRICAIAHATTHVEFRELQERLGISKSALSKHIAQLVGYGYLREEHRTRGGHSRLRLSLTELGRRAYRGHTAALKEIIEAAE